MSSFRTDPNIIDESTIHAMHELAGRTIEQIELLNKALEEGVHLLDDNYLLSKSLSSVGNTLSGLFDQSRNTGFDTGYESLNTIIGGLKLDTLTILGGSTGMGKSILALNILINLAKTGVKVCYFDLENGFYQSVERVARIWAHLPKSFFMDKSNESQLELLFKEMGNFTYYSHEDLYKLGFEKKGVSLIEKLASLHAKYMDCKVFLIDPLQALEMSVRSEEAYNEQGKIIQSLKDFAQSTHVALIVCHHIRKSTYGNTSWVEDVDDVEETKYRIPTIDDLRGSGKIADFATDVWGMVRSYASSNIESRGKTLLRVLKNRSGNKGDVRLYFDESTLKITQLKNPADQFKEATQVFDGKAV